MSDYEGTLRVETVNVRDYAQQMVRELREQNYSDADIAGVACSQIRISQHMLDQISEEPRP